MTRTLLRGGLVLDGTGAAPRRADVVLADGRIAELSPAVTEQTGDTVVEVSGLVVMPGLIDCHVHTMFDGMDLGRLPSEPFSLPFFVAVDTLRRLLRSGVTTVRDAGGADLGVKVAQERGLVVGPRLRIAVSVLSQTGGHADGWTVHGDCLRLLVPHPGRPDCVVDGPEAMRRRVRELIRAGADVIKVCASGGVMSTRDDPRHPQFSFEELSTCVETAADAGLPVMAHAHGAEGIERAVRAGVRSIEHGVFLDERGIDLMLEHGTWLVPTLLAPVALVESLDAGMAVPPEIDAKARSIAAGHLDAIARAHAAGVPIALGTDSGVFPHGSVHRELELLVSAGLSPAEALVAATSNAAKLLDLPDVGTLEVGARADLLVVDGPWDRFSDLPGRLRLVVQDGEVRHGALVAGADGLVPVASASVPGP